jgi:hypothetical protein
MGKCLQEKEFNWKKGWWVWCLHCERCYQVGEYKIENGKENNQWCPYPGCDGHVILDAWTWHRIRKEHPEYPEVPERGKEYQL